MLYRWLCVYREKSVQILYIVCSSMAKRFFSSLGREAYALVPTPLNMNKNKNETTESVNVWMYACVHVCVCILYRYNWNILCILYRLEAHTYTCTHIYTNINARIQVHGEFKYKEIYTRTESNCDRYCGHTYNRSEWCMFRHITVNYFFLSSFKHTHMHTPEGERNKTKNKNKKELKK